MNPTKRHWLIGALACALFLVAFHESPDDTEGTIATQEAVTALGNEVRMSYPLATHCAVEPDGVEICTQTERNLK